MPGTHTTLIQLRKLKPTKGNPSSDCLFSINEKVPGTHTNPGQFRKFPVPGTHTNPGQFKIFPVPGTHTIPEQFIPKTSKKKSTKVFSGFLSVNFVFDSRIHLHRVRRMCHVFCVLRRRIYLQALLLPLILR